MHSGDDIVEYVSAWVGGQLFGLPIARVQDVFIPERLTRVPLAGPEVAGLLNLRGRIVTAIDLRRRLSLPGAEPLQMAVGVECQGESYGLLIERIGDVLKLASSEREANPVNLDPVLASVSAGIYRLEGELLVVLDVDRLLAITRIADAA